jgi:hypothetical protein
LTTCKLPGIVQQGNTSFDIQQNKELSERTVEETKRPYDGTFGANWSCMTSLAPMFCSSSFHPDIRRQGAIRDEKVPLGGKSILMNSYCLLTVAIMK